MNIILIAFLFSVLLSIIDFLSETLLVKKIRANSQLMSFVAGVAITYIILHLLLHHTRLSIFLLQLSQVTMRILYRVIFFVSSLLCHTICVNG